MDYSRIPYLVGFLLCVSLGAGLAAVLPNKQTKSLPVGNSWLVFPILLLAAALRFYGIDFGLPHNFHSDEVPKLNAIMNMVANHDLNPRYFLHPSLLLYSSYFLAQFLEWFAFSVEFRELVALSGRLVSATAGVLSVFLVFRIGALLYGRTVGLMAAAALAVFPLHVTCSRYMKEDALLVCLFLAVVVFVLEAVYRKRLGYLFLAGLFAGFTTSSKYSGLLSLGVVLAAPWLSSQSLKPDLRFLKALPLALMLAPVGFVILTPYSVLDYQSFLAGVRLERAHMLKGHTVAVDAWSQLWMYHLSRSIVPGIGLLPTFVALVALGFVMTRAVLIWRRESIWRMQDLFIAGLFLVFYLSSEWVKSKPAPQPERYILPCLPFLAIILSEFLSVVARQSFKLSRVVVGLAFVIFALPLFRSIELASEIRHDTRDQMQTWMLENIPQGARVYVDWKPYTPLLPSDHFNVAYIPRHLIMRELDLGNLKRAPYDYLLLSSLSYARYFKEPYPDAAPRERLRRVFRGVPVVKQIAPRHGTYGFHNPTLTLFSLKPDDFKDLEVQLALKQEGKLDQTINDERASFEWIITRPQGPKS